MSHDHARFRARYWPVPLARAIVAAAVTVGITFSSDHSPVVGLVAFGALAVVTGLIVAVSAPRAGSRRGSFVLTVTQGATSVALGTAALLALLLGAQLGSLVVLVVMWAVATGAAELAVGLPREQRTPAARDQVVTAAFTLALALAYLAGREDSVFLVGALGAYAAVVAVYLGIAAFSLKWDTVSADADRSVVGS